MGTSFNYCYFLFFTASSLNLKFPKTRLIKVYNYFKQSSYVARGMAQG